MPDTMTGSKESLKLGDELVPEYLGPADRTGTLFQKCLDDMDMISEHCYNYDSHFDLASAKQVPNAPSEPLDDWMRRPANHILQRQPLRVPGEVGSESHATRGPSASSGRHRRRQK
jgi:hypothetical protein